MQIRKIVTTAETIVSERSEPAANQTRRAAAAAVLPNPWIDASTRSDLGPVVARIAPQLGLILTSYITKILGPADSIRGFGKGAIIGVGGEWEHGAALLHNPFFGNVIRERLAGTEYISFADTQAPEGATLTIPMANKDKSGLRDYFETIALTIDDAPRAGELVVAVAAMDGPRPNARIGDRTTDPSVKLAQFADHYLYEGSVP